MSERRTMPSGAEVFTFPSQNPDLWDDNEHFYSFQDCKCGDGRMYAQSLGCRYAVQCTDCWARHFHHPETQRIHKEQLAALNAGTNEVDHYFHQPPTGTP